MAPHQPDRIALQSAHVRGVRVREACGIAVVGVVAPPGVNWNGRPGCQPSASGEYTATAAAPPRSNYRERIKEGLWNGESSDSSDCLIRGTRV